MDSLKLAGLAVGWAVVVGLVVGAQRAPTRRRLAEAVGGVRGAEASASSDRARPWSRRRRRLVDDLPEMLDDLTRSLRSGRSLRQALMALPARGALAAATRGLHHELDLGRPIPAAVATWIERLDDPLADLAGAALAVAIETGGAGATAVDRVAATVRDRRAIQLEAAAQASQARASALVIGFLPIGFFVLATSADPASAGFLLGTPLGLGCLLGGLGLDAVGLWWMHRITTGVRW